MSGGGGGGGANLNRLTSWSTLIVHEKYRLQANEANCIHQNAGVRLTSFSFQQSGQQYVKVRSKA